MYVHWRIFYSALFLIVLSGVGSNPGPFHPKDEAKSNTLSKCLFFYRIDISLGIRGTERISILANDSLPLWSDY